MAIVQNFATEIGDIVYIKADAPVTGIVALVSYSDVTVGETGSRFFKREFRYTLNGITWSDWITLTNPNLIAVSVSATDLFQIEYQYTRDGTDPSDVLEFQSVTLNTTTVPVTAGKAFDNSIFKEYFNADDATVLSWAVNVMQKMYEEGVVPNYIMRGEDNKAREDEDYINYWLSVTQFFSYFVQYARQFENFPNNTKLLAEYLREKGLFVCNDDTLPGLQEIKNNMFREFRYRGGLPMYRPQAVSGTNRNGELLRLICYDSDTEFMLGVATQECATWCLDHTAPDYNGLSDCKHLLKGYEPQEDVLSLSPYPLFGSTTAIFVDGSKSTLRISGVVAGQSAGIGDAGQVATKALIIDPKFTYEICFQIKVPTTLASAKLTFGCLGFNSSNGAVSMESIVTGGNTNYFFQEIEMNQIGEYYFVRGILYGSNSPLLTASEAETSLGLGANLRFNANIIKIIPYIALDNTSGGGVSSDFYLWDIKVKPAQLTYSHTYLDQGKWVDVILRNKSGEILNDELEYEMRRKLIPYNTSFQNVHLENFD